MSISSSTFFVDITSFSVFLQAFINLNLLRPRVRLHFLLRLRTVLGLWHLGNHRRALALADGTGYRCTDGRDALDRAIGEHRFLEPMPAAVRSVGLDAEFRADEFEVRLMEILSTWVLCCSVREAEQACCPS